MGNPGTWGVDDRGLIIEALPGKKVLMGDVDVILELHRFTERTKNLKAALMACPCLAKPATCHPVRVFFFSLKKGRKEGKMAKQNKNQ